MIDNCFSYAKVNLFLSVVEKRRDKYHDLISVFVTIDVADELSFFPRVSGDFCPSLRSDFCLIQKAYKLFYNLYSHKILCSDVLGVLLKKNIPMGAGLGGGSSDAATTLCALNKFYGTRLSEDELIESAALLGADVPFFIRGGLAKVTGIGDVLDFYDCKCVLPIVVVYPNVQLSTSEAFVSLKSYDDVKKSCEACDKLLMALKLNDIHAVGRYMYNSFEAVQFKKYPYLRALKKKFLDLGALGALMSGTGSSVFGIFKSCGSAYKAAELLKLNSQYTVFSTSTVTSKTMV